MCVKLDWKEAKDGNSQAVESIVEQYYRFVYSLAYKWVKADAIEHDDGLSLAMTALMKCINGQYDPEKGKFSAYLARAVDNEIRLFLRQQRRSVQIAFSLDETRIFDEAAGSEVFLSEVIEDTSPGPAEILEYRETVEEAKAILRSAERKMSLRECQCLRLAIFAGLSRKEIAEMLGVAPMTVSRVLWSGRRKLRRECQRILKAGGDGQIVARLD